MSLLLSALLDALAAGVERALATCLRGQLLSRFLLCSTVMSSRARGSGGGGGECATKKAQDVPAFFFSRKALSSSSRSLFAFFAAFRGLALPPAF